MYTRFILLFSLIGCLVQNVSAENYPEVIFANSDIPGSYAKSQVLYDGDSWVANVNHKLLVSDTVFFTPGNSLSLHYINGIVGNWSSSIFYKRDKFNHKPDENSLLSFKLYVESDKTTLSDLPSLSLTQFGTESQALDLSKYIDDYQINTWIDVKVPVRYFQNINHQQPISGVLFKQNKSDKKEHRLYIDQIEFTPAMYPKGQLSSPAVLTSADAYGHHVLVKWQLPLTPSIRYIKIYRSNDNVDFQPITILPIHMQSSLDYVPDLDTKYYYKLAWVDYDYKESPFSQIKEVNCTKISDKSLLDLVQIAHINYFVDNYDINSGLHLPFRMKDRVVVSTKETGYAVLSMLVGVERGHIPRNIFLNRLNRILDFLNKAQSKYGVFASYYNGRDGLPEYLDSKPSYSVSATTKLIESLLIARQYLKDDSKPESSIKEKITKLWDNIEWPKLVANDSTQILKSELNIAQQLDEVRPLSGFNESMNTYILAAASTTNNFVTPLFMDNISSKYVYEESKVMAKTDSISQSEWEKSITKDAEGLQKNLKRISLAKNTIFYGVQAPFGEIKDNELIQYYVPFISINPDSANTKRYNFKEILNQYVEIQKRRDNENAVGTTRSNVWGYLINSDAKEGRISPAISIGSVFINKQLGIGAIKALYNEYGSILFTNYGFRTWLDLGDHDVSEEYNSKNQALIALMIENARTGLIWKLYSDIPEIKAVKNRLFN